MCAILLRETELADVEKQVQAQGFQPVLCLQLLQNRLTILQLGQYIGRDDISQLIRLLHIHHRTHGFLRHTHACRAVFLKILMRRTDERLHFGRILHLLVAQRTNETNHAGFILCDA